MVYDMESYLRSTVERYTKLASQLMGKPVTLKKVSTPFLSEDQRGSPARKPCDTGGSVSCPWCMHSFKAGEGAAHVNERKKSPSEEPIAGGGLRLGQQLRFGALSKSKALNKEKHNTVAWDSQTSDCASAPMVKHKNKTKKKKGEIKSN